jgi:uncharacterized membrane protein YhaH (DUF805 family)
MNFSESIKSGIRNFANFKGRATRSEYWYWTLFAFLIQILSSGLGDAISTLISIAVLLPSIAVSIRRMHDTDHRGWWMIVPIVNFVFSLKQSDPNLNRFGPPSPPSL